MTADQRAYYETHEPPHCPTCGCGVADGSVTWIKPTIDRIAVSWPACEGKISTPETILHRRHTGQGLNCTKRAKVDYRGTVLCVPCASRRALLELVEGPKP